MDNKEIAKELTVALINRMNSPNLGKFEDKEHPEYETIAARWIGKQYVAIHEAVLEVHNKYYATK